MSCLHSHVSYDDVQSKKIYGERSLQSFTLHLFVPSTTDVFKAFFEVLTFFVARVYFLLYFVHPDSFLHSNVVNSIEIQWFRWYWFRFDIEDWSGFNFAFYVTWNTKMYLESNCFKRTLWVFYVPMTWRFFSKVNLIWRSAECRAFWLSLLGGATVDSVVISGIGNSVGEGKEKLFTVCKASKTMVMIINFMLLLRRSRIKWRL